MKKHIWIILLIVAVVAVALLGVTFSGKISQVEAFYAKKFHQAVDEKIYAEFKKTADKFNQRGPTMVSKTLRLDKTTAGPGARITYFYTFTNYSSHDLDRDKLSASLQGRLDKVICTNDKIKPTLKLGATYAYVYSGNDGVELVRLEVNKQHCSL